MLSQVPVVEADGVAPPVAAKAEPVRADRRKTVFILFVEKLNRSSNFYYLILQSCVSFNLNEFA
jgi:hypothetical protein